jgi:hypothetical protein
MEIARVFAMIVKKRLPRPKPKPRGEQLLDRLDKNPKDQDAWDELARATKVRIKKPSRSRQTKRKS